MKIFEMILCNNVEVSAEARIIILIHFMYQFANIKLISEHLINHDTILEKKKFLSFRLGR